MHKLNYLLAAFCLLSFSVFAQENQEEEREQGHVNTNKFRQLYDEFATPNMYRTASGAPGAAYYQQQADYKMDIELDDKTQKLYGEETITYTNNSPDKLEFLWVQLDQNVRTKDSKAPLRNGNGVPPAEEVGRFASKYYKQPFDGGFNIEYVKDNKGNDIPYIINQTMMRVNIPKPLESGEKYSFKIKWWYNVNNHIVDRARSGYEHFEENGNNNYVIAQFFPRMAVYNDVEGWQNHQFWGSGEFALPFGNYEVNITVPADHILDGTGVLQNPKDVLSKEMMERYEEAKTSFDKPVFIVTEEEARENEKEIDEEKKTWTLKAENVRDFAFTTSRKYIWEMQAVKTSANKTVMAVSIYSKEGNPLWEEYSTKAVVQTLKTYSKHTFPYPYPKAISVHARNQGMEYPMICWNYGRPNEDGTYSDRTKYGMISVIIHEVGHNYFPMIVNSDERQWGWMDEGINTFCQYLTEQEFAKTYPQAVGPDGKYPSRRGEPSKIVDYMKGKQDFIAPIMSNPENVYQLGANAYGKPATALNILRETVMGPELFDHAFQTYAQRWMFKHPTPEDFFRTMEDASAVDLDWYWRGWFYTTDYVDIGVKNVRRYHVSSTPNARVKQMMEERGMTEADLPPLVYLVAEDSEEYTSDIAKKSEEENFKSLNEYLMDNFTPAERANLKTPKYFYEVTFSKPGGIPMPLIVEYTYKDGSKETITYPVEIWRKNDAEVKRVIASDKEITEIAVDPKAETADIDTSNNVWPEKKGESDFEKFKEKVQE
ncbi:M1 family metallopeptidase [Galbibacter sp. EGI 63066]|uniref:M1 family metallopeptidase n=1 Tax=Galbibacter sp. EGI 63066 TaxID=2993559 RepID=UPI00224919C6|nr:M1 family metallopeptidase [Galbibacter sp. EGI 63066]MCX2680392.1 M1 family metallopeptidase [Galbibacter sp. EGI 63066]